MKKILALVLFLSGVFAPRYSFSQLPYLGNVSLYNDTVQKVLRVNYQPLFGSIEVNSIYIDSYGPNPTTGAMELQSQNYRLDFGSQSICCRPPADQYSYKLPGQARIPTGEVQYGIVHELETRLGDTLIQIGNRSGFSTRWDMYLVFFDPSTGTSYRSPAIRADVPSIPQGRSRKVKKPHPTNPNR